MKPRFSDERIIQFIKEQGSDERTADVSRRHWISTVTFYKYKARFRGR